MLYTTIDFDDAIDFAISPALYELILFSFQEIYYLKATEMFGSFYVILL